WDISMRNRIGLVILLILTVACSNNSPTGPSNSIPNVTGNYSGTTNVTYPELGRSVTCPTSTSVTQSGSTVNIAPLVLTGPCGNQSVPFGQVSIDATGAIDSGSGSGTYNEPSCGTYSYTGSGGFFGRDLRISLIYNSQTCYNFNLTINLSR